MDRHYGSYHFFFFQAEDGIRDYKVTGVQTCALPIFYGEWVWLIGDTNFFTDRREPNPFAPSELDWIVGIAFRWQRWEVMAFQETDQSIDRGGLTQKYFAIQVKWSWETQRAPEIHTRRPAGTEFAQREW